MLVLLAGAPGLIALPLGADAVRVSGLSVLWWYGAVVAPCVAVLVTVAVLLSRSPPDNSGPPAGPRA